jgi:hypothetical protein
MRFLGTSRLFALIGLIAVCAFAGDIVADSMADSCCNHCVSQSSQSDSDHEKTPCSHCSCCAHSGTVIVSSATMHVSADFGGSRFYGPSEQSVPTGLPCAIDHPPQLA